MYKYLILLALLCPSQGDEARRYKYSDPFAALDRQISLALASHMWPWSRLMQAAAALDVEESLEEPLIISEPDRFQINLSVKRYKPDELRIKVKNRYIIVEGKHKEKSEDKRYMANHFVQRFVLPAGSRSEEVTAVLKPNGMLSISAPRHELPPPPPEREVPIQVLEKEDKEEKDKKKEEDNRVQKNEKTDKTEKTDKDEKEKEVATSSVSPVEQQELVEATTHVGKIRKKDLKTATKPARDNEVTKGGEDNGLDYALLEPVE